MGRSRTFSPDHPAKSLIPRRAVACLATLLLFGCDSGSAALGSWVVASVDGVGTGAATALRIPVPAGTYGELTLIEGWMWKEYMLDSLAIEFRPDGTFSERKVEASSSGVTRSSFERPDYVPFFGGELIREDVRPGAHVINGTWFESADTLRLVVTRDDLLADTRANLEDVLPDQSEAIRLNVEGALPPEVPPRWTGVLRGDRLELMDGQGRGFVFRRPGEAR